MLTAESEKAGKIRTFQSNRRMCHTARKDSLLMYKKAIIAYYAIFTEENKLIKNNSRFILRAVAR